MRSFVINLRPWLLIDWGPSFYHDLKGGLFVGFGWREDAREGEICWRHGIDFAWDWWPRLMRLDEGLPMFGEHDSASWTGRTHRFMGWRWRRRAWIF